MIEKPPLKKPAAAAFLSLVFWGAGQFYNGQFLKGCLFMLTNIFIVPWMYSIWDAYVVCDRHNRGEIKRHQPRRWYVAVLTWLFMAVLTFGLLAWVWSALNSPVRHDYNILAKNYLNEVAVGAEMYAREHEGKYPAHVRTLLQEGPPYLRKNLCGSVAYGFEFFCYFDPVGYRIEAHPVEGVPVKGLAAHAIVTGGVFSDPQVKAKD